MVKIQKISEIEPRLGFTEFDMLKKYRQSFATSELGCLHALFPFSELAQQMHLHESSLGRKSYFSPEGKIALMVLKSYTNFSDSQLIEHLNGNIHYQLLCKSPIKYLLSCFFFLLIFARKKIMRKMSKEEFLEILSRQQRSGLTIKDFCVNEAYTESSFYYWKGKFGLSRPYHAERSSYEEFAPVNLNSPSTSNPSVL